jgi:hypothetical protein
MNGEGTPVACVSPTKAPQVVVTFDDCIEHFSILADANGDVETVALLCPSTSVVANEAEGLNLDDVPRADFPSDSPLSRGDVSEETVEEQMQRLFSDEVLDVDVVVGDTPPEDAVSDEAEDPLAVKPRGRGRPRKHLQQTTVGTECMHFI